MNDAAPMNHPMEFSDADFVLFQNFISQEMGIYFSHDRKLHLQMALDERLAQGGCASYREYYHLIQSHPRSQEEVRRLIELITVGETSFFRNGPHFTVLMNTVLPEIMERKKKNHKTIRVWSAGCSRGSEPYSIAIALKETVPSPQDWDISIFATDINHHVLDLAQKAVYTWHDLSHMPAEYITRYFEQTGHKYQLADQIKKCVKFSHHNLAKSQFHIPELQNLDIIFCRNVTIYFDLQTTKRIVEQFYDCLSDGGYLFIGHAETLWQITDKYELIELPQAYIYKKTKERMNAKTLSPFTGMPEIPPDVFHREPADLSVREKKGRIFKDLELKKSFSGHHQAENRLAQATLLANQAQYEEAIKQLEGIVEDDSLCLDAHYLLGVLYYNAGLCDQAIAQFRKVIYIDPGAALSYFNLGNIYLHQKKIGKAKKEFENVLGLLEKRQPEEMVKFSDDFTADYLLRACENNLAKIEKSLV